MEILKLGKEVKNCRPISLLSVPFKLLKRIISRIKPYVDDILPDTQAGFRPYRSSVDQVTQRTDVTEDGLKRRRKSAAAFNDLTAAYDTVWYCDLCLLYNPSRKEKRYLL